MRNVQFISAPSDIAYTLKMQGYQEGSFALDVDKQTGNEITESTSFQGIPSSTTTIATMDVPVCLNKNAKYHKTMKMLSSWGHSGKGFYYYGIIKQ